MHSAQETPQFAKERVPERWLALFASGFLTAWGQLPDLNLHPNAYRGLEEYARKWKTNRQETSSGAMSKRKLRPQKRRRRSIIAFEMIRLDRTAGEPLHQQLYRQIRDERNREGSATPRLDFLRRGLLLMSGVSRDPRLDSRFQNFIPKVISSQKRGSVTFVANLLPEAFLTADQPKTYQSIQRPFRISDRVRAIPDTRVGNQFDLGQRAQEQASHWSPAFRQSTNFRSLSGNASERRFWRKRGLICCAMRQSRRRRPAQGNCSGTVRFQSGALSSGSDRNRGWHAASDVDDRNGCAESGSSRLGRKPRLSADHKGSYFGRR